MTRVIDDYALLKDGSKIAKVLSDLRDENAAPQIPTINPEILQQVKDIELGVTSAPGMASLKAAQGDEIEKLALIDPLTELYNTKTFFKELKDELKRALRYHRPTALCVMSVDGLSEIAEKNGNLTKNAVLRIVANVIKSTVRENDICARFSQEQFAMIFPDANAAGIAILVDKLRQRVGTQAISYNWTNLKITASLGLASFPVNAREYDELIARAEEAMQLAVQRGGDRVCLV